ncbi:aspartyl aminopeptidase [Histomonas meleagridis]|uniref:aspartyl aminopeptidase n=1 Tax=Histomonas meleagridis TaxID=135588 RepID=UPI0035599ACC|nr:aspartyl aminopeptidase [Histomonas meleagridis]KAH0802461.1 aspartyl aminopeptidase [Histomonas meleagridis]
MEANTQAEEICNQIEKIPTPMHFIQESRKILLSKGFTELSVTEYWDKIPNKFFVVRDEKNIVAISMKDTKGGLIFTTCIDAPCLKYSTNGSLINSGSEQVKAISHGQGNWQSWEDRDLRIAGRVLINNNGKIESTLFVLPGAIGYIQPSGKQQVTSKSNDELIQFPIFSYLSNDGKSQLTTQMLVSEISKHLETSPENIIDFEITFYDSNPPKLIGPNHNILASPRITDLSTSLAALQSFAESEEPSNGLNGFVGFSSDVDYTGPESNLLSRVLDIIGCKASFYPNSLVVTCHNVHGDNPAYDKFIDNDHPVKLGNGIYYYWSTSDFDSVDIIRQIAEKINVKLSPMVSRNNGKKTFGEIFAEKYGIRTVEVGIPVWGMFSARETCNVNDIETLNKFFKSAYALYHQIQ